MLDILRVLYHVSQEINGLYCVVEINDPNHFSHASM